MLQERHLLVKVIDRILYKLDDLVRPFVHKVRFQRYQLDSFNHKRSPFDEFIKLSDVSKSKI